MPVYRVKGFGSDAYATLDGMIGALVEIPESRRPLRAHGGYGGVATLISFGPPKDEHTFYRGNLLEERHRLFFAEVYLEPA